MTLRFILLFNFKDFKYLVFYYFIEKGYLNSSIYQSIIQQLKTLIYNNFSYNLKMFEEFSSNPKISQFMHLYPKSQWKECITWVIIIGISAVENSFQKFLSTEDLKNLAESTPLPLSFQIPELKNTLSAMKETIDNMNLSLEKEDKKSKKAGVKKTQKLKRTIPNPILIESTPRFKVLDDVFSKQKWKKESPLHTIKEDNNSKSPLLIKSSPKPKPYQRVSSANKKNLKLGLNSENKSHETNKTEIKQFRSNQDINFTDRNFVASPTLEELLSNSRFTVRDDGKNNKNYDSGVFESKMSLENSVSKGEIKKRNSFAEIKKGPVSIAEGFLRNPLISQLAHKTKNGKKAESIEEDGSKISIRSYSPINSLMLLERDDF